MRGGRIRYVVALMVMGAVLVSLSAGSFKIAIPGRAEPRLATDATAVESKWQVQAGKDVNLVQGKGELGIKFWQYGGKASVSFLAQDMSIFRNGAPTAIFAYSPSTVLAGDAVSFSATSVEPGGDSIDYLWD